ncbi:MAG: SDR family NAD(P)-dependent oxidoreductase [Methylibium sp.]|uniref:SDR family NAD(P)-dependent oxidoreductase n=1 Tax=Methylibium sp. TaxID=2067992 RepID=UPI0017EBECF5|nr:SDR family NAD(P)-dependent oxidoreductase [Methylibium sp.]MBA3598581.1 SDR family NAD(P)-dependent oxidoreductase [Methylibium sp.]
MHSLPNGYRALVLGASGAIGGAFVEALQGDPRCAEVLGLSRRSEPAIDLLDEASLIAAAASLQARTPIHLIVVATGALHQQVDGRTVGPEKRLAELDPAVLAHTMALNAIGPALVAKHFHALLPLNVRSIFAVLSARVGSIGDNRKGGWYGYRASKAALNQLWRTAAIEIARRRPEAVLVALQPGTVRSALTAPVIGAEAADALAPDEAVQRLLAVLDGVGPDDTGGFFANDGARVPW